MAPTKIMVIRHAEKPPKTGSPQGVTKNGDTDPESLSVRGWQRAGALAVLFGKAGTSVNQRLSKPDLLFASRIDVKDKSQRPQETLTPLAELLSIEINDEHRKKEEADLVGDIMGRAGVVLVAWEHTLISEIATAILGDPAQVPQGWKNGSADDRFDMVWVFTAPAGKWVLEQVPQLLLAGDRSDPIPSA
jgi:hypothetical protein